MESVLVSELDSASVNEPYRVHTDQENREIFEDIFQSGKSLKNRVF